MFNINFIKENNIIKCVPLNKGWSGDKKYILKIIHLFSIIFF